MSGNFKNPVVGKSALVLAFDTPSPVDYGGIYDVVSRAKVLRGLGYGVDYVGVAVDSQRLTSWGTNAPVRSDDPFRHIYVLPGKGATRFLLALRPTSALRRKVPIPTELRAYLAAQRYDVILIDHIKMIPFAQQILSELDGDVRLRMHNDEAQYYASLAQRERNRLRAGALWLESVKYARYQRKVLRSKMLSRIYYISRQDEEQLSRSDARPGVVLPVVANAEDVANGDVQLAAREIDFIYVGNLDLEENLRGVKSALQFLVSNEIPVRIAVVCGRCKMGARQSEVINELMEFGFCNVKFNVSHVELAELYKRAKFFLNFSTGVGGVKTKLIDALARGLVVITNDLGVRGSGLEEACIVASAKSVPQISSALMIDAEYEQLRRASIAALRCYTAYVHSVYEEEFGVDSQRKHVRE